MNKGAWRLQSMEPQRFRHDKHRHMQYLTENIPWGFLNINLLNKFLLSVNYGYQPYVRHWAEHKQALISGSLLSNRTDTWNKDVTRTKDIGGILWQHLRLCHLDEISWGINDLGKWWLSLNLKTEKSIWKGRWVGGHFKTRESSSTLFPISNQMPNHEPPD